MSFSAEQSWDIDQAKAEILHESMSDRISELLAVPQPAQGQRDIVAWVRAHMRTERGRALDFDAHPYMTDIIADQSEQKGFMCASQVGKTTMAISEVFGLCDTWEVPLRVIYTMHTDRAVQEFSQ